MRFSCPAAKFWSGQASRRPAETGSVGSPSIRALPAGFRYRAGRRSATVIPAIVPARVLRAVIV